MESTRTGKTHLKQLLDQISPSFRYTFENECLEISSFGVICIDNIQRFATLLKQSDTPIISLDLASNLINILNSNISVLLVNEIRDEGMK
jgi:hypothetical protein